jgi:uncharacterized protein YdiU (UPF0061 family)
LTRDTRSDANRHAAMRRANPKYVLRNHLAQHAIEAAEARDYTEIARLHAILRTPFDDQDVDDSYAKPPAAGTPVVEVSCSS